MTPTKTRPHKPMLAEWTSEILSLPLSLKGRGCICGRTRSLASYIACPTCLTTAFMLKFSGTTLEQPSCGNWAGGIVRQYCHLGVASPFSTSGITCLNSLGFQANVEGQLKKVWGGLHVSPRTARSKRANLCTYFAWLLRPSQLKLCRALRFQCPLPGCSC